MKPKKNRFIAMQTLQRIPPLGNSLKRLAHAIYRVVVACCLASQVQAQDIVTPVAATSQSYYSGDDRAPGHAIDGTGMTPGNPVTASSTSGNDPGGTMWLSNANEDTWITFDLGSIQTISGFHLWNYNEKNSTFTGRGIKDCGVYAGTSLLADGSAYASAGPAWGTLVENMTFTKASGTPSYTGEDYTFTTPVTTRYIQIYVTSNFRTNDSYTGISEIRFYRSTTPQAKIKSFGPGATIGPVAANAAAISWGVPSGSDLMTQTPTFTLSDGATCTVNGSPAVSGETRDFTSPVHYIVQASDFATSGTTTDYTVTVKVAQDGTWIVAGNGSWSTTTNWASDTIADGAGGTADFTGFSGNITLDGDRTIGNLIFSDPPSWNTTRLLSAGSGGSLTLAGPSPTISLNEMEFQNSVSISTALLGTQGFTKNGVGTLYLAGGTSNTLSGPITVTAGLLGSANSEALKNITSAITVAPGATFDAKASFGAPITNNFTLSGTGTGYYGALNIRENAVLTGAITLAADTLITHDWNVANVSASITGTNTNLELKTLQPGQYGFEMYNAISLGTGALTLTGVGTAGSPDFRLTNTNSYTGGTLLNGGRVTIHNASALGSGTVTFVSDTTLTGVNLGHANPLQVNFGVAATLGADTSTGWTQSAAVTGDGTLTKSGLGTVVLDGGIANTFTGPITVSAGTLGCQTSASLQNMTGDITVASGATFDAKAAWGPGIANNFILSGTGSGINGHGALNIRENAGLSGAITLAADTLITHDWNIAYVGSSITGTNSNLELKTMVNHQFGFFLWGPISLGTGSLKLNGVGTVQSPDFDFSGTLNYTGETVITSGNMRLSGPARLPDSSTVRITTGAVLNLDFAGTDTVAALYLNGASMPPGTYGSVDSTATNKSADFLGAGILDVVASYSTWASANGIPGQPASGDFDNDGLSNIVEYALGLSPTASSVPPGTFNGSILSFTKGTEAIANGDVTYEIEQSTTLDDWTVVVPNAPASATISYTLPSGQPKEFARLKITQIP